MAWRFRCPSCGFRGTISDGMETLPVTCVCGKRYEHPDVQAELPIWWRWGDVTQAVIYRVTGRNKCGACKRRQRILNEAGESAAEWLGVMK